MNKMITLEKLNKSINKYLGSANNYYILSYLIRH